MSYNGWTNRETWALVLWIDNEEGSYNEALDSAREAVAESDDRDERIAFLAGALEDRWTALLDPRGYIDEFRDIPLSQWVDGPGAMALDIGDLSAIDWHEAAASYIDAVSEEA